MGFADFVIKICVIGHPKLRIPNGIPQGIPDGDSPCGLHMGDPNGRPLGIRGAQETPYQRAWHIPKGLINRADHNTTEFRNFDNNQYFLCFQPILGRRDLSRSIDLIEKNCICNSPTRQQKHCKTATCELRQKSPNRDPNAFRK